jgi:hypothetical protein
MNRTFAVVLCGCAVIAGGMAVQRASAQDGTRYPGQATRAAVWIQNQGQMEAIPVSIENVGTESTLRVELAGVPRMTIDQASIVQARTARQTWGYRSVTVAAGQDPAAALNGAGADGWETTGVAITTGGNTVILMKRPI